MLRMMWKKATEVAINGKIPLVVYRSNRSKLCVTIANVPGPMVRGHISFATETSTDDGLPHTLEHLVFMGSKNYPYKGILDVIANRCLASGTNASTDQDHTSYTLTTAGSAGFLKVLPVYLDHLLSPLLTDSQYITEVHHINGEGIDSGVVYSEMQDHESEMEQLVDRERKRLFYPKGSSYSADTGGLLPNLRTSCSPEKVRNYHKEFYHLNNMMITVSGVIDHKQLLNCIEPVETEHITKIPQNFVRPFQTRIPPIEPKKSRILCPSDDESIGMVEMSWLGPPATDLYTIRALMVLFDYMTDSAAAPLKKDFVQVDDPYCSSVYVSLMEQTDCEIVATFMGVPVSKLDQIQQRFFDKTMTDHMKVDAFDLERIGFILDQESRSYFSNLENNAHSFIKDAVVGHQLYGSDNDVSCRELATRLSEVEVLKKLKAEPREFWHKLFQKYFTKNCACVLGEPSEKAVEEIAEKEEQRINAQCEQLGEAGLAEKAKLLESAIDENTRNKPTAEILQQLIVRDYENFNLIPVQTFKNTTPSNHEMFIQDFPFHVYMHEVPSDFVELNILYDTDKIASEDRYLLMLFAELMFQSPAMVDGKLLDYEEVAKLATRDLVSNVVSVGVSGVFDRFFSLKLRVDTANYENLAKWADIYLKKIVLDPKRAMNCAKKLANKAADIKRDGNSMVHFLNTGSSYEHDSNTHTFSYLTMENYHKNLAKAMEDPKKATRVIEQLDRLRNTILASPLNVHFVGDSKRIVTTAEKQANNWSFLPNGDAAEKSPLECTADYKQDWRALGKTRAITVGGSESAFLMRKCKFDSDWNGPTTMQTLLLTQYLCQCEGPLWTAIRGTGLAYDASLYLLPDRKALTLSLYRCSQLVQAYERTKETVFSLLDNGQLDESQFEAAKRSLVCELVGGQSNVKLTGVAAVLATIRNVDLDFTQKLCSRIWHAKMDDVLQNGAPAIRRVFDPSNSICSIALNPSRLSELKTNFPEVEIMKLEEFQVQPQKF